MRNASRDGAKGRGTRQLRVSLESEAADPCEALQAFWPVTGLRRCFVDDRCLVPFEGDGASRSPFTPLSYALFFVCLFYAWLIIINIRRYAPLQFCAICL